MLTSSLEKMLKSTFNSAAYSQDVADRISQMNIHTKTFLGRVDICEKQENRDTNTRMRGVENTLVTQEEHLRVMKKAIQTIANLFFNDRQVPGCKFITRARCVLPSIGTQQPAN
jgi:hypothetical protein